MPITSIALGYYEQISDVTRDQKITQQALDALGELIRRYPNTRYAADARLKIDLVRDHLAGKEMEIGRFYETRGQWLAATLRFRTVVDKYQTTTHAPEALMRLTETLSRARRAGGGAEGGGGARRQLSRHRLVQARLQADAGSSRQLPAAAGGELPIPPGTRTRSRSRRARRASRQGSAPLDRHHNTGGAGTAASRDDPARICR